MCIGPSMPRCGRTCGGDHGREATNNSRGPPPKRRRQGVGSHDGQSSYCVSPPRTGRYEPSALNERTNTSMSPSKMSRIGPSALSPSPPRKGWNEPLALEDKSHSFVSPPGMGRIVPLALSAFGDAHHRTAQVPHLVVSQDGQNKVDDAHHRAAQWSPSVLSQSSGAPNGSGDDDGGAAHSQKAKHAIRNKTKNKKAR